MSKFLNTSEFIIMINIFAAHFEFINRVNHKTTSIRFNHKRVNHKTTSKTFCYVLNGTKREGGRFKKVLKEF